MKYYLYISDAKIDMLYPQIPHDLKKHVKTEVGMDVKFVKASRTTEKEIEENRFTKLAALVAFIEESGTVGSLDEPREYVHATLPMRFATWGRSGKVTHLGSPGHVPPGAAQFVCFAAQTERHRVVLWGSWKHMLGYENRGEFSDTSTSMATFALWDFMDRLDTDNEWRTTATEEERAYFDELRKRANDWRQMHVNAFAAPADRVEVTPFLAMMVNSELHGPEQKLEFFAKRFHYRSNGGSDRSCFLGTPIYVATAD
jgi:hypothetical protein